MSAYEAYMNTAKRLEPEIAAIDQGFANASIAISLKRIADALEIMAIGDSIEADIAINNYKRNLAAINELYKKGDL